MPDYFNFFRSARAEPFLPWGWLGFLLRIAFVVSLRLRFMWSGLWNLPPPFNEGEVRVLIGNADGYWGRSVLVREGFYKFFP